jgi:hypothetical protein
LESNIQVCLFAFIEGKRKKGGREEARDSGKEMKIGKRGRQLKAFMFLIQN